MIRSDLALAALACAAVPGMRPVTVQGWRHRAEDDDDPRARRQALIEDATGRRWEVLAPREGTPEADIEHHDPLVRQLSRHLPFKVPVAAGSVPLGESGRAVVFPHIEGSALDLHRLPPGPGLASAVGRAVAAIHNIPVGLFEEYGAPVFDAQEHRERRLATLDRAAETGHVPTGLLARWEHAFDAPQMWRFAPTSVHGSLHGRSFRVAFADDDASSGRVVAVTGWAQAAVTDPAQDFAVLVDQAPPPAVDSVLESYALARSQRPDPHLLARARLAAEMRIVDGLAAAVVGDDEARVRRCVDQLRKLDRLTSADDSLVPAQPVSEGPVVQVSHDPDPAQADAEQDGSPEPAEDGEDGLAQEPQPDVRAPQNAAAGDDDEVVPQIAELAPQVLEAEPAPDGRAITGRADGAADAQTQVLPVVRLGDDLDERTRLQDLYDVPADDASELPTGSGSSVARLTSSDDDGSQRS